MAGNALAAIFYISRSLTSESEVLRIVAASRQNNRQREITGALLWTGNFFVQVLEGELARIVAALRMISRDERHTDIRVLSQGRIDVRQFADWDMALVEDPAADGLIEPLVAGGNGAQNFLGLRQRLQELVARQGRTAGGQESA